MVMSMEGKIRPIWILTLKLDSNQSPIWIKRRFQFYFDKNGPFAIFFLNKPFFIFLIKKRLKKELFQLKCQKLLIKALTLKKHIFSIEPQLYIKSTIFD